MPVSLEMHLDLEDVIDGFDATTRRAKNLTKVWRDVAPALKDDIKKHNRRKEAEDGAWPPYAPATEAKRERQKARGKRPKPMLGKLRTGFGIEWGKLFIRARSKIPWSAVHQDGATVAHGARVPSRQNLWASDEFLDKVVNRILSHLEAAW